MLAAWRISTVRGHMNRKVFLAVFPGAIEILFDNGYVVRAADGQLGFTAFYQQWTDATQSDANISEEGSILFKAAGPTTTQVRVIDAAIC